MISDGDLGRKVSPAALVDRIMKRDVKMGEKHFEDRLDDLEPIRRRVSIGDEVYEELLSLLIFSKLAPESHISIDAMSRRLGVSQTPIRAALIKLESQGLVTSGHNRGFFVASLPSPRRFEDLYDYRALIEPEMAARAAAHMDDQSLAELVKLKAAMDKYGTKAGGDHPGYAKFALDDNAFHRWIIENGGNAVILECFDKLHVHTQLFRLRYHSEITDEAIKEHSLIVDALFRKDAQHARDAMSAHIAASRKRMEPFFRALSD